MGLSDILKKKKEENKETVINELKKDIMNNVKFDRTIDNRLKVEFYDDKDFKQFYDTTRLIIKEEPINIFGENVYNCIVSWYGDNDCHEINPQTGKFESIRASQYRGVLVQLNLDLLQNDSEYCKTVMQGLLDKKRVEEYLDRGLQEEPDKPCGKYIGGVVKTDEGYRKFFSEKIGRASHNSSLMVDRRRDLREKEKALREKEIMKRKAEIARLSEEIEDMSK